MQYPNFIIWKQTQDSDTQSECIIKSSNNNDTYPPINDRLLYKIENNFCSSLKNFNKTKETLGRLKAYLYSFYRD